MEFKKIKGTVVSALVNGEADIEVLEDGFALTSVLDTVRVPWVEVTGLSFEDYIVNVRTKTGAYAISKLGLNGEPLYNHMLEAYGTKVRESLFVRGTPLATAKGDVFGVRGVPIEVYENSIVSLPPDLSARRMPLCFADEFDDKDYGMRISVMDGSKAEYLKLGYDHAPATKAVKDALKVLREKTLAQITELDPSVNAEQSAQLAKLMPEGMAAPIGLIRAISPSFASALEDRIAGSRAAETYKAFQEMTDADIICIGFKKNDMGAFGSADKEEPSERPEAITEGMSDCIPDGTTEDAEKIAEPYMLWLIAPSQPGNACAVEFAGAEGESAATYVYRFACPWDEFRIKLSMALEAIAFKRDVIRFSDEELLKPENAIYLMANDRNEALNFVRQSFAGRAIHRSMDSWKNQLTELFKGA